MFTKKLTQRSVPTRMHNYKKYLKDEAIKKTAIGNIMSGKWSYYGSYTSFSDLINAENHIEIDAEQMPKDLYFGDKTMATDLSQKLTYYCGVLKNSNVNYGFFLVNESLMALYQKNLNFNRQQNIPLFAYRKNNTHHYTDNDIENM